MRLVTVNEEVLVASDPLSALGSEDIAELKERARANRRRRVRICAHSDTSDSLHEMMIVHMRGAYVRPHKHVGKSESVHVVEGEADALFFDEDGAVVDAIALGPYGSGRRFFYRLEEPVFHTLLINSEFFVMHEVTNGPFKREETTFASWAPGAADHEGAAAFQRRLATEVAARR
ncbi:MAG: WbuC family cupin fold metalloprotein [Actinobacteria bacterium]|nr:WbuC family cupin fold metalloprotein [Actinomycetota bacterium]